MNKDIRCIGCGKIATGYASIDFDRYCHGDLEESPTCYEQAVVNTDRKTIDDWLREAGIL